RYADAWRDGQAALDALASGLPRAERASFSAWREHGEAAWTAMQVPRARRAARQQMLNMALTGLPAINESLSEEVKREVDYRNNQILLELEKQRSVLTGQVIASSAVPSALAVGLGFWLARPLAQIENAIGQLGGNRYARA